MTEQIQQGDRRKECCKPENGNLRPHTEPGMPPNVTCMKCSVCGCRHFEATLDPGQILARGSGVG